MLSYHVSDSSIVDAVAGSLAFTAANCRRSDWTYHHRMSHRHKQWAD